MASITTWAEAHAHLEEILDESGEITIAGVGFYPSRILHDLDPVTYHIAVLDYLDAEGIDSDELEE